MIPVVRNNWEVLSDSTKSRSSNKRSRQGSECHSKESLSSGPLQHVQSNIHKKQNLGTQNARITAGSLPSNVHSVHLNSDGVVRASAIPPHVYRSICGSYPVNHLRNGQTERLTSQPKADATSTVSLPAVTQDVSSPTKHKGSHKGSLLDRLRRSVRLYSGSSTDEADIMEGESGTRASS